MTAADDLRPDRDLRDLWARSKPLGEGGHLDEGNWRAFLEGTLDTANRDVARAHIASCPDCAAVFKSAHTAAMSHIAEEAPSASRTIRRIRSSISENYDSARPLSRVSSAKSPADFGTSGITHFTLPALISS